MISLSKSRIIRHNARFASINAHCFQTTMAFSHCYTSLESVLKAKWRMIWPPAPPTISTHVYEIRPRADKCGIDLISDVLPYSPLWYRGPNAIRDAINSAKVFSRSHHALIRVYGETGNVIEMHEHTGELEQSKSKPKTKGRQWASP
jgi:hypothetical protein